MEENFFVGLEIESEPGFSNRFLQVIENQFGFVLKCIDGNAFFENKAGDRFQVSFFGKKINPKMIYRLSRHYYRRDRHYR